MELGDYSNCNTKKNIIASTPRKRLFDGGVAFGESTHVHIVAESKGCHLKLEYETRWLSVCYRKVLLLLLLAPAQPTGDSVIITRMKSSSLISENGLRWITKTFRISSENVLPWKACSHFSNSINVLCRCINLTFPVSHKKIDKKCYWMWSK